MKRLLIIRVPFSYPIESAEALFKQARERLEPNFYVLLCNDGLERIEFEIVYDPHFKPYSFEFNGEPVNEEQLRQRLKEFLFDQKEGTENA